MNNAVSVHAIPNDRDPISVWRVYLPIDVDREEYIKTCYLTGSISIINQNAEVQHKVKVGKLALQLITFPIDEDSLGSEVVCISAPYSGTLYVVDIYTSSSEFHDQKENQYRLYQTTTNGFAEVRIDGNTGKIILSVDGEGDTEILLNVTNKDKTGKLSVNVNGDIVIQNQGNTSIKSSKQVSIDAPKILLSGDEKLTEQPIILGDKLVELLTNLLTQLSKESAGPYPLLGQSAYAQLQQTIDQIKSTISFVK